jgi:hypothetical protein
MPGRCDTVRRSDDRRRPISLPLDTPALLLPAATPVLEDQHPNTYETSLEDPPPLLVSATAALLALMPHLSLLAALTPRLLLL